jgi:hypothetical protein
VVWTGDYLNDTSFKHTPAADAWIRENGVNSVLAAPLIGEEGWLGAILIDSKRKNAWNENDADLVPDGPSVSTSATATDIPFRRRPPESRRS